MELVFLFAMSVAGIFIFRVISRRIERSFIKIREKRSVAEIANAPETRKPADISLAVGICEFLSTACIAAATAFGLVLLYVGAAEILIRGGMPMRWLYRPISWAGAEHETLDFLSTGWIIMAILLAMLALALIAGRDRRRAVVRRFEDAQREGIDRLLTEKQGGHWVNLPSTEVMNAIETEAKEVIGKREEMLGKAAREGISAETVEKALQARLEELRFQYAAQDILRRLRLEWRRIVQGEPSLGRRQWLQVRNAFVSKGLVTTLNSGSKLISFVTLTLLFASAVTLGTGQSQAVIARIEDLAVGQTWNSAQLALSEAKNVTSKSNENSAISKNSASSQEVVNTERAIAFLNKRLATNYESGLELSGEPESRAEKIKAEILAQDIDPHDLVTAAAQRVMKDEVAHTQPSVVERAAKKLQNYMASWHEPDTASNFRGVILDNVVATVLDTGKPNSFSGQVLKEFAGDVTPDAIQKGFQSWVVEKWSKIASAKDDRAVAAILVSKPGPGELPPTRAAAIQSATNEATKHAPVIAIMQRPTLAEPDVVAIARSAGELNELRLDVFVKAESIMNAVSDYNDLYVVQAGIHNHEFEMTRNALQIPEPNEAILNNVGHNFNATVAAKQTGGVVIGRPGPDGQKAEVRDFTWTSTANSVMITLTGTNGQQKTIGPFEKSIVHQALAYVADGRVAAVTMLGTPFDVERVTIHPALTGTVLGCNVIASDTWIFDSVEDTQAFKSAEKQWYAANDLYKVAWATRLLALINDKEAADELTRERELAREGAAAALRSATPFSPRVSHITEQTNYYEPQLVKGAVACATEANRSLSAFENCIAADAVAETRQLNLEAKSEDAAKRQLLAMPPEFGLRSGLTEAEFSVDSNFNFLNLEDNSNPLWPFNVAIQAVAESAPEMLEQSEQNEYVERKVWTFETLQPLIKEKLIDYLNNSPEDHRAFLYLRQFSIAQRLFRAALNGTLGDNFPLERLAVLSRETDGFAAKVTTPQWYRPNLHHNQSAMTFYLHALKHWSSEPGMLSDMARAEIAACIEELEGRPGKCPDKARVEQAKTCTGAECPNTNILKFAAFVGKLRETAHTAKLDANEIAWPPEKLKGCVANAITATPQ